jgi:hypothetical protein
VAAICPIEGAGFGGAFYTAGGCLLDVNVYDGGTGGVVFCRGFVCAVVNWEKVVTINVEEQLRRRRGVRGGCTLLDVLRYGR